MKIEFSLWNRFGVWVSKQISPYDFWERITVGFVVRTNETAGQRIKVGLKFSKKLRPKWMIQ